MQRKLLFLGILLCLLACQQDKKNLSKLVYEWHGRSVKLPANSVFTIHGKDTVNFTLEADYKVLVYIILQDVQVASCDYKTGTLSLRSLTPFLMVLQSFYFIYLPKT